MTEDRSNPATKPPDLPAGVEAQVKTPSLNPPEQEAVVAQEEEEKSPLSAKSFLGADTRIWTSIGSIVGVLSAVIALLIGYFEYNERVNAAKAGQTLQLINEWEAPGGASDGYKKLRRAVLSVGEQVPAAERNEAAKNPEMAERLRASVARRILRDPDNQDSFEDVIYFFTKLNLCIEADLCSSETARVFFFDTLGSFLDAFGPEIERRQSSEVGFALEAYHLHNRFQTQVSN